MGFSASRAVCALVFVASTMMTPSVLAHAHLNQQVPCSAAKFFAPKRIKLCTAATERKTAIAHGAN